MKMIVRVFTRVVLITSFVDFVISSAALASEYITLKSTSKKAKEQDNDSSADHFDVMRQNTSTHTNEENVKDHHYQLAVQEEKKRQHDRAAFHYALALGEEKNQSWKNTSIVHTNQAVLTKEDDCERLQLTTKTLVSERTKKSTYKT